MATTISKQNTNYNVVTDNGILKLEGTFSIDTNGRMNYNVSIYQMKDMVYIGSANYYEMEGDKVSYSYNIPTISKADVIALLDTSIQESKVKQATV